MSSGHIIYNHAYFMCYISMKVKDKQNPVKKIREILRLHPQASPYGKQCRLRAIGHAQLGQNGADIVLYRALGEK